MLKLKRSALGIVSLLAVSACASTPIPRAEMASARTAIESAQVAGADQYAPVEINRARDKLMRAQLAVGQEEHRIARQLAREAQVEATLAQARSAAQRATQAEAHVGHTPNTPALR